MSATPVVALVPALDLAGVFDELLFTTRHTLGGGYDKNCAALPKPVDDHAAVDDSRTSVRRSSDTPNKCANRWSVQARGDSIGIRGHNYAPDSSRILTLSECLIDGPAFEIRKSVILGKALGVGAAERLLEPSPEIRQPHVELLR